ncbi:PUA-like domain-containing protein [Mycena filopes]|nr:PUA-like domain-containing protein [Mycena filopes]
MHCDRKVHGHNGIAVGTMFSSRRALWNAGVHGMSQAGIHGTMNGPAYSIVMSGRYADDLDNGDTFIYSGAGGTSKTGANGNPTYNGEQCADQEGGIGNTSLQLSALERDGKRVPVRVVRGSTLKSQYAPEAGYRYDGLYQVTEVTYTTGKATFKTYQFKFERLPGQPPLLNAPHFEEDVPESISPWPSSSVVGSSQLITMPPPSLSPSASLMPVAPIACSSRDGRSTFKMYQPRPEVRHARAPSWMVQDSRLGKKKKKSSKSMSPSSCMLPNQPLPNAPHSGSDKKDAPKSISPLPSSSSAAVAGPSQLTTMAPSVPRLSLDRSFTFKMYKPEKSLKLISASSPYMLDAFTSISSSVAGPSRLTTMPPPTLYPSLSLMPVARSSHDGRSVFRMYQPKEEKKNISLNESSKLMSPSPSYSSSESSTTTAPPKLHPSLPSRPVTDWSRQSFSFRSSSFDLAETPRPELSPLKRKLFSSIHSEIESGHDGRQRTRTKRQRQQ